MKTTELRIGNIVKHNGSIIAVPLGLIQAAERLKPVPITEERLLEFGFVKLKGVSGNVFSLVKNDCEIRTLHSEVTNWSIFFCLFVSVNTDLTHINFIRHVHQLQNLYHALTGEEL